MLFVSMVMWVSVCDNAMVPKRRTKRKPMRDVKRAIVVLPLQIGNWDFGVRLGVFLLGKEGTVEFVSTIRKEDQSWLGGNC